ncbi:MAG: aldo/keto reductase, partial [Prevotella sp.]|nr:aldo/keto reductase [Prevotella sp.]
MNDKKNDMNRRQFIKHIGTGTLSAMALMSLEPLNVFAKNTTPSAPRTTQDGAPKMTYRVNHHTNDKVSLLGFGMMRLPKNQDKVN